MEWAIFALVYGILAVGMGIGMMMVLQTKTEPEVKNRGYIWTSLIAEIFWPVVVAAKIFFLLLAAEAD